MDWSYALTVIAAGFLAWIGYKPVELIVEYVREEGLAFRRQGIRLTGRWFAAWESTVEGKQVLNAEEVSLKQRGLRINIRNVSPSPENPRGGYLWRGELRIHHSQYLIGSYESVEAQTLARGSLYFHLNAVGRFLVGRWAGCSYDSACSSGAAVIAMSREFALLKLSEVCQQPTGPLREQIRRQDD